MPEPLTPKQAADLLEEFSCALQGFNHPYGGDRLPELQQIATRIFVQLCGQEPDERQLRSAIAL